MKKRGKGRFGNIKRHQHPDGTVLDSKREYNRYCELLLLQKAGEIRDLHVHPRYPITVGGIDIKIRSKRYPNGRVLTYVADFEYYERGQGGTRWRQVIEDVKMQSGHRTEVYKIKRALMEAMGHVITEY